MAANTLKFLLPITKFFDTEIALAIKLTYNNEGQNVDTKYWLNHDWVWLRKTTTKTHLINFFIVHIFFIKVENKYLGIFP